MEKRKIDTLYDRISAVLTNYEMWDGDNPHITKDMYDILVDIQNWWDYIIVKED